VALWALKPDKIDAEPAPPGKYGAFAITVVTFFGSSGNRVGDSGAF
jgi:hypothetical protein